MLGSIVAETQSSTLPTLDKYQEELGITTIARQVSIPFIFKNNVIHFTHPTITNVLLLAPLTKGNYLHKL